MPKNHAAAAPAITEAAVRAALPFATDHDFVEEVIEDYRPAELPGVTATDLAQVLSDFWRLSEDARGQPPAIRLVEARGEGGRDLGLDVLEVCQDDAPFLVDSIMGEVTDSGAEVKAMFHPVIERGKERRSLIQVWLAPQTRERRRRLVERVGEAIADVRLAVADWPTMPTRMGRTIAELAAAAPGDPAELAEDLDFLRWMDGGHFIFLGARLYDFPRTADGGYAAEEPLHQPEGSLGVLRDQARAVLRRANEPAVLSVALRRRLEAAEPLVVAKSNLRSRVHRRAYMDYVGVRRYGADGKPAGEVRFVGLFTAQAYNEPASETPLLRQKVARVMAKAGFQKGGHNATRLANILETYPRDELFQMRGEELLVAALDILHLSDRPRVKLFVRQDPFDRFVSVLLFAPRERYDTRLRQRAGDILAAAYGGRITAYFPTFTDAPLARARALHRRRHPRPPSRSGPGGGRGADRQGGEDVDRRSRRGDPPGAGRGATGRRHPRRLARSLPDRLPRPLRGRRRPDRPAGGRGAGRRPGDRRARLSAVRRFGAAVPLQALPARRGAGAPGQRPADSRRHGPGRPGRGRPRTDPDAGQRRDRQGLGARVPRRGRRRAASASPSPTSRKPSKRRSKRCGTAAPKATASTAWSSNWARRGARRR